MTEQEAREWCRQKHVEIHEDGKLIRLDYIVHCTIEGECGIRYGRDAFDSVKARTLVAAVKKARERGA